MCFSTLIDDITSYAKVLLLGQEFLGILRSGTFGDYDICRQAVRKQLRDIVSSRDYCSYRYFVEAQVFGAQGASKYLSWVQQYIELASTLNGWRRA